jgi:hypothetical protein
LTPADDRRESSTVIVSGRQLELKRLVSARQVMVTSHIRLREYPFSGDISKTPTPTGTENNMAFCFKECDLAVPLVWMLPLSDAERDEIKVGRRQFFVWGETTYRDAFETPHYLHFCVSFGGANLWRNQYEYCSDYNDAD